MEFKQNGFVVTDEQIVLKFKNDKPLLAGLLTAKAAQKRGKLLPCFLPIALPLPVGNFLPVREVFAGKNPTCFSRGRRSMIKRAHFPAQSSHRFER
jgi:hypothetical protein